MFSALHAVLPGLALSALLGAPALAGPVAFDGSWKQQRFSLFSANSYGFGGSSVSITSDGSVSLAYRRVDPAFWGAGSARWTWSVAEGVPPTDLTRKGGDDRNAALYFVFLPEAEAKALGSNANVRKLLTADSARVLVYVWGGNHGRGKVLPSPYLGARGKTVVLRGAGTGSHSETVDLAKDYARAFGGQKGALVGLALSADSDDTDSRVVAQISGLSLD